MALGRPDDIGQQVVADSAQGSVQDPHEGMSLSNAGVAPTTIESFTSIETVDATSVDSDTRLFQVEVTTADLIIAKEITLSDGVEVISESFFFIAKPVNLRGETYEGSENSDEFVITNVTAGRRLLQRVDALKTFKKYETIFPSYNIGDRVFATVTDYSGIANISLIDINDAGRVWDSEEPKEKFFQIIEVNENTFQCQEWDFVTNAQKVDSLGELLDVVLVAKPHALRGDYWDGLSITTVPGLTSMSWAVDGGATQVDDHILRTQTPTPGIAEGQEIHPAWWADTTIIRAERMDLGTGAIRSGIEALWQDANDNCSIFGASTRHKWFVVVTMDKDTFYCREWDIVNDAAIIYSPDPGLVLVAKPITLQGSEWHALTVDGVDYVSTDGTTEASGFTTRTATDTGDPLITEEQIIIPKYVESITLGSKILAVKIGTGALRSSIEAQWQDTNQAGRAFAKDANA